jgi:hypothetical protein
VEIRVDESGKLDVEMQVDSVERNQPMDGKYALLALLTGESPQESNGGSFLQVHGSSSNNCTGLRVETEDGVFEAVGSTYYSTPLTVFRSHIRLKGSLRLYSTRPKAPRSKPGPIASCPHENSLAGLEV